MKVAVFDHVGNWGGGSRFTRALLIALKQHDPSLEITYFGNRESIIREKLDKDFLKSGISVRYLATPRLMELGSIWTIKRMVLKRIKKYLPILVDLFQIGQIHREIEKLAKGFDVALFPWPYFIECPNLDCPMVGVFHDFNYKYFFGSPICTKEQLDLLNRQIPAWLEKTTPVVSSRFTGSELARFYPEFANKVRIVHLAPFSISTMSDEEANTIVKKLGINNPYIIYPTNLSAHKNVANLMRAMYFLCKTHKDIKLLFTGPGTEFFAGAVQRYGIEQGTIDKNVIGLGYVTNEQMDALIQCAKAVISTSVYEAGNGPGLDAWSKGVPVIMSDIPSFVEHLDVLGVRAKLFDPTNPIEIAEKINEVLSDYADAIKDAEYSKMKMQEYTWSNVAEKYYAIISGLSSTRF